MTITPIIGVESRVSFGQISNISKEKRRNNPYMHTNLLKQGSKPKRNILKEMAKFFTKFALLPLTIVASSTAASAQQNSSFIMQSDNRYEQKHTPYIEPKSFYPEYSVFPKPEETSDSITKYLVNNYPRINWATYGTFDMIGGGKQPAVISLTKAKNGEGLKGCNVYLSDVSQTFYDDLELLTKNKHNEFPATVYYYEDVRDPKVAITFMQDFYQKICTVPFEDLERIKGLPKEEYNLKIKELIENGNLHYEKTEHPVIFELRGFLARELINKIENSKCTSNFKALNQGEFAKLLAKYLK